MGYAQVQIVEQSKGGSSSLAGPSVGFIVYHHVLPGMQAEAAATFTAIVVGKP